jgi:hypothetical protein
VYEIQSDEDTTPFAGTDVGLNATYTTTAGNTTTGISKVALDSSATNTTATFPLKILGISRRVGNQLNTAGSLLDFCTVDVMWNTGLRQANIVGVA